MTKNIVLIGLMGSGKTTIGRKLAEKLNMKFVDTDELIVKKAQKSIKLIFAEDGELFFRDIESEIIEEVSNQENIVISTGGGAVLKEENIDNLKKNGILFHLFAPAEELFKRIKDDSERPLINTKNPVETLKIIQGRREIFYNQADFKIITSEKTPEEAANEIIKLFVL